MLLLASCLLLAVAGVEAGSRAWQPPIQHARSAVAASIAVRDLSGINNVYFNGTNVSSSHHAHAHARQKRYYGITTPNGGTFPHLWPDGNIEACFEQESHTHQGTSKTTREILETNLVAARELWRQAGLDDKGGKFEFIFLDANDPKCSREQRSTHLYIMYAGEGVRSMSTTVGIDRPRSNPDDEDAELKDLGPSMTLVDLLDIGMGNVVANYAHEMGVSRSTEPLFFFSRRMVMA